MSKLIDLLKDKEKMKHYFIYIVFGALTTVVDFVTFFLLSKYVTVLNENISNAISIFVSTIFAYFTNRIYVFKSKEKNILKEFGKFFISRMSSSLFNIVSFWILTTYTNINSLIIKAMIAVVVVILNYITSKLYVFKEGNKKEAVKEEKSQIPIQFFIILFFLVIVTFSYFGMKYYAVADDNNQLGVFHLKSDNIYEDVIQKYKSYNVRPFAFLFDAYIFQWFWDNMYALLVIMVVLHIFNIYLFYKICEKIDIKLNEFCLVLFAVSPILIEALYWISASTRIVFSLFLVLSSIYLLLLSFEEENTTRKLIEFMSAIIINFISVGFYEQTIALNLFLFAFVLICLKKYKYIFIPIMSTTWIGIYYAYFMSTNQMQARGTLKLNGIFESIKEVIKLVSENFRAEYYNTINVIKVGFNTAIQHPIALTLLTALVIYFIVYLFKNKQPKSNKYLRKIIFALIVFVAPFLPFIVLDTSFIATRNMYLSWFGVCVILDLLLDLLFQDVRFVKSTIISAILICLILVDIDRIDDYKKVSELDDKMVKQIIDVIGYDTTKTVSINYNPEDLIKCKNLTIYVQCAAEADWAMQGKIQVARKNVGISDVYINSGQDKADYVIYFDENMNIIK